MKSLFLPLDSAAVGTNQLDYLLTKPKGLMMKKNLLAVVLFSAFTAPAFASDSGAYLSLDYGQLTYTDIGTVGGQSLPNPGKFGLGAGYNFSPNFGAELGYQLNGNSTLSGTIGGSAFSATAKTSSIVAAAVGNYPLNDQFGVFGKLGIASNSATYDVTVAGSTSSKSYSKTDLYYAAGGKYNINKSVGLYLQYENFGKYDDTTPPTKGAAMSFGVIFGL